MKLTNPKMPRITPYEEQINPNFVTVFRGLFRRRPRTLRVVASEGLPVRSSGMSFRGGIIIWRNANSDTGIAVEKLFFSSVVLLFVFSVSLLTELVTAAMPGHP